MLYRGWGHATSCLNASWINELTVTADAGIWDQLYPASNAHPYFDSLGESSSRFLLWTQVIINTHKQLWLSCRLFKRGINKYNPLQWGLCGEEAAGDGTGPWYCLPAAPWSDHGALQASPGETGKTHHQHEWDSRESESAAMLSIGHLRACLQWMFLLDTSGPFRNYCSVIMEPKVIQLPLIISSEKQTSKTFSC